MATVATRILFLHGLKSKPGGSKPRFLHAQGYEIINPALPVDDFNEAVRIAQRAFDTACPGVVVGSSRGSAVAMNIDVGEKPLILIAPAWRRWGNARTVKPGTVILHSRSDDVIPLRDSQELVTNSNLAASALVVVGLNHRMADEVAMQALAEAVKRLT